MDEARWKRIERTIEYLTNQQSVPETHEALERARHRTATVLQQTAAAQQKTQQCIDQLVQAQRPTDERLNALTGVVDFPLNLTPPRAV